jgi:hypothetical protein
MSNGAAWGGGEAIAGKNGSYDEKGKARGRFFEKKLRKKLLLLGAPGLHPSLRSQ